MDFAVQLKFTGWRENGQEISVWGSPEHASPCIVTLTTRALPCGASASADAARTLVIPKLHEILRQMNGRKRFCFDFGGEHLLLSVSLGRSIRKNAAGMARLRVLKSTSIFFNQGWFRPGPIG
ncbi:hypothetical protein [Herbaspirillum sp. C9C3]|uniref:hypothetical protein n=1 Tax=Herbaspirillum sp. C9C3 TaxID=2735271 RepID=UPI00158489E4|nr:hypothetical protein [Herbaspirillum sp. C9C3]NUT60445.1 hypothetical protein [Herbaspirillum sp. C9C3]